MILPATPVLPDYTAAGMSLFSGTGVAGLRGLGQTCIEYDPSTGDCVAYDTSDTGDDLQGALNTLNQSVQSGPSGGGADLLDSSQTYAQQGGVCLTADGSGYVACPAGVSPGSYTSIAGGAQGTASQVYGYSNFGSTYQDASGNTIVPFTNGQKGYYVISPSGGVSVVNGTTGPAQATAAPTMTAAQTAALSNATTQAFNLAKLLAIQPGTVQQASGATSRQATGLPISTVGGSISGISSSTIMILGVGLLAVMLLAGGKR
jgi:hypothetical protein